MLRSVTAPNSDEQVALVVALMDFSELLAAHIPTGIATYLEWEFSEAVAAKENIAPNTSVLSFGGRDWLIAVSPTEDSPFGPDNDGAFIALLLGAIATSLAVAATYLYERRVETAAQLAAARESTHAKLRFIAAISHELRTPLTAVLGFADILKDGSDLSIEQRYTIMKSISEEATELGYIIDDLMVAARSEIGHVVVIKRLFSVRDEVRSVVSASGLGDRVEVWPTHGGSEMVIGDAARVRQILRNLVENARRYGGGRIEVEITSAPGTISVEVRDDGIGVSASILKTVFEPFQHSSGPIGVTESLGLGLTISGKLAELMAGELTYERRGEWTVFRVTLPDDTEWTGADRPTGQLDDLPMAHSGSSGS
jgi:signal transduction histidine kinase